MTTIHLQAKIKLMMRHADLTEQQFIDCIWREKQIRPDVSGRWLNQANDIRQKTVKQFIEFWQKRGIPFDMPDFSSSLESFERKISDLSRASSSEIHAGGEDYDFLLGRYQIIRPYVSSPRTFVLEAMEIERRPNGRLLNLFVTHNQVEQRFVYHGDGYPEPRYYFAFLTRPQEDGDGHSHRSICFYSGEPRSNSVMSGLMLRGVSGAVGKEAVAVPFLAIRMKQSHSLHGLDSVDLVGANDDTPPLKRLHPGSNLLAGEVREHTHKKIFQICYDIFRREEFIKATLKEGDIILNTVTTTLLRDLNVVNEQTWQAAIDSSE